MGQGEVGSDIVSPFVDRSACPACGSNSDRTLTDLPYGSPPISDYLLSFYGEGAGRNMLRELDGLRFVLLECDSCGAIWQQTAPTDDLVDRLYEGWIDPAESLERDTSAGLSARILLLQEIMSIVSALGRPPGELQVFDFGMGWGRWLLMARAVGCQVWGAELSPARLEHAEQLAIPTVVWDEISRRRFDVINTEQVFEHLVDPYSTLVHLSRALAPGGLLKISVPPPRAIHRRLRRNDWSAPKFSRNSLNAVAPLEHLNCYQGRSMTAMAERAGLEPVFLPLRTYYRFVMPTGGVVSIAKQLARPVYRSVLKRGAYRFFRRPPE